jgi:hypothetical protein
VQISEFPTQYGGQHGNSGTLYAYRRNLPSPSRLSRSGPGRPYDLSTVYREVLPELIETKVKGLPVKPRTVSAPAPVINLMSALKRSLAREAPASAGRTNKEKRTRAVPDQHQPSLLLPVSGGRRRKEQPAAEQITTATGRRKKA